MSKYVVLIIVASAGLGAGWATTILQQLIVLPYLLEAEALELPSITSSQESLHLYEKSLDHLDPNPWSRILTHGLINAVIGVGFSLLLAGAIVFNNSPITARTGLLWGIGGFFSCMLAPALSLPPMPPGSASTAGHEMRQILWIFIALGTSAGLMVAASRQLDSRRWIGLAFAICLPLLALFALPSSQSSSYNIPPVTMMNYRLGVMGSALFFWLLLGASLGYGLRRNLSV